MMQERNKQQARVEDLLPQEEQLPAFGDLVQRYGLFSESPLCNIQIGQGGSLYCNCEGCSQWQKFVEGRSTDCKEVQYEVFTAEHVKGLAHYLLMRAAGYELRQMNVLEVGAGSGRLFHHLKYFLSQLSLPSQGCVVKLTATDSGQRSLNGPQVAKQDAIKAISEERPHMVLVSWMPIGVDWTAHIRATPSVLEYILIGEIDDGICGDPWLTWGYTEADNSSDSSSDDPTSSDITDGHLKTTSCSNYGPGRPVRVVKVEPEVIPIQFSKQGSPSENSHPLTVSGLEGRVQGMYMGSASSCKKFKLGPESMQNSSTCEGLATAIQIPLASARIDDTHGDTGPQMNTNRKTNIGLDMPLYAADGWVRTELASLSSLQICRTDERWSTLRHSHTVSFRRCAHSIFESDPHKTGERHTVLDSDCDAYSRFGRSSYGLTSHKPIDAPSKVPRVSLD